MQRSIAAPLGVLALSTIACMVILLPHQPANAGTCSGKLLLKKYRCTPTSRHTASRPGRSVPTRHGGTGATGAPCGLASVHTQKRSGRYNNFLGPIARPCPTATKQEVSTYELALKANAEVPVPVPMILTAPPRGKREVINIPTWFWLDDSQWGKRTATATAGGASATVTASAYELLIDPGDDTGTLICHAPWSPYKKESRRRSNCTHEFKHPGRYEARVTVNWGADWSGSDGDGGTLPTIGRTVTFPIHVVEARSELIGNP